MMFAHSSSKDKFEGIYPKGFIPLGFIPLGFIPLGFIPLGLFIKLKIQFRYLLLACKCTAKFHRHLQIQLVHLYSQFHL